VKLTFLGAAGTVTGSRYLLEFGTRRFLVDCGLFQGLKELRLRNREPFPVPPAELEAVVLTHAHLDHSGYLPVLVRDGFRGPVRCTAATADLCEILLVDAGQIEEETADRANRHGYTKHRPALPLFTREDAVRALERFSPTSFDRDVGLGGDLAVRFHRAGHIPGAASVVLTAGDATVVFSGDLGRPRDPILDPPTRIPEADYLVVESTYGDRKHDPTDPQEVLAEVVNRTVARGGSIVIPAFAVGRTQTVLYHLAALRARGEIPRLPIFVDSPMAQDATRILLAHPETHRLTEGDCVALHSQVRFANSVEESKAINWIDEPMIVISASGMATGGRVLFHLSRFAPGPENTILFVGHQAAGTRGAKMLDGADTIRIHGEDVPVRAEVVAIHGLSAHADADEIMDWLRGFERPPLATYVTHGEPPAAAALRDRIERELGWRAFVPAHGESVVLR